MIIRVGGGASGSSGSTNTPEASAIVEMLWDDLDLIAWDDGDLLAWD